MMASGIDENTPLLGAVQQAAVPNSKTRQGVTQREDGGGRAPARWLQRLAARLPEVFKVHVEKRILFAGFLITLSFSFTQVP